MKLAKKIARRCRLLLIAMAMFFPLAENAAELGDPAPHLEIAQWVKGGPFDLQKESGKRIYVLVFWDSGCSACQAAVPDLIALQKSFQSRGVALVCITPESAESIQQFVQTMGGQLNFALGADDNGKSYEAYMRALGKIAVPYAFVIDKKGTLAWHGHPLAGLDKVLEQMVTGKFDIAVAKRAANAEKLQTEYFALVTGSDTNTPHAARLGNRILNDGSSNPWLLNNFAYRIAADPRVKSRDLPLAIQASKTASEARGGKDPAFLDTYARVLFESGRTAEAIKTQKEAITFCADQHRRSGYEQTLRNYEERMKK